MFRMQARCDNRCHMGAWWWFVT